MDFKDKKKALLFRIGLLILTIFAFVKLIQDDGFIVTILLIFFLLGVQIISLIKYLNKTQEEFINFLKLIEFDDLSHQYSTDLKDDEENRLNREFNKILQKLRSVRKEREAEFQYLKNIVQHVGIGLITFNKNGEVQIINTAAKKLLKIKDVSSIYELRNLSEPLVDTFMRLRTGGRDLIRLEIKGEIVQLAIYAIELTLRHEEFKLVSIQNIQNELEEKEMEAWQNLVRVLTHEIMNSVTPITSLATTVEEELTGKIREEEETQNPVVSCQELEDIHLAVQTIKKRSQGLVRFVQDFRNLTHIPVPKLREIAVQKLLDEIAVLLKKDIQEKEVQLNIVVDPGNLTVVADKDLIEQVLINLVKNATQAFNGQIHKLVELRAYKNEKGRPVIAVRDNGCGIEEEALDKIFIPFFTTKKQGSGIGLSLSRQIMRKHQGTLTVKSLVDEGTEFFLKF